MRAKVLVNHEQARYLSHAILLNRQHSSLSSQIKTLEKVLHAPRSDKEHRRLVKLAASWRE